MVDIKPQRGYMLIKTEKEDDSDYKESKSGIMIPNKKKGRKEANEGKVIKVGVGRMNNNGVVKEPPAEEGDTVLYKQYAGHKISETEEYNYELIKQHDVIALKQ